MPLSNQIITVSPILSRLSEVCEKIGYWEALLGSHSDFSESELLEQKGQASLAFDNLTEPALEQRLLSLYHSIANTNLTSDRDIKNTHNKLLQDHFSQAGSYRSTGMGFYRDNKLVHMTAGANQAAKLTRQLLLTLNDNEHHPLLQAVNFLYEFEFIQPFAQANGCLGRLWFTGLLQQWKPFLLILPFEQQLLKQQHSYYATLKKSVSDNDSTRFISFLLEQIQHCVEQMIESTPNQKVTESSDKSPQLNAELELPEGSENRPTREKLLLLLEQQPQWSAARAAAVLGISARAVEKHISRLKRDGLLDREGSARAGRWRVTRKSTQQLSLPEY